MEELKEGGMDEGKHPAGSQSQWQSDRWRGLAPNVCFLRVCLYASASKCEQGLGDGGSPVQLMSWQVGPPPPSLPKTLTPPHILSPNTATQGPTSFPDSFFYSISGFNLVGAAPLRSRPWADVWQLKDSHLLSLNWCQRSWEWPSPMQEEVRTVEALIPGRFLRSGLESITWCLCWKQSGGMIMTCLLLFWQSRFLMRSVGIFSQTCLHSACPFPLIESFHVSDEFWKRHTTSLAFICISGVKVRFHLV